MKKIFIPILLCCCIVLLPACNFAEVFNFWNYEKTENETVTLDVPFETESGTLHSLYNTIVNNAVLQEHLAGHDLTEIDTAFANENGTVRVSSTLNFTFYRYIDNSREGGYVSYRVVKLNMASKTIETIQLFEGAGRAATMISDIPMENAENMLNITVEEIIELIGSIPTDSAMLKIGYTTRAYMLLTLPAQEGENRPTRITWKYTDKWELAEN